MEEGEISVKERRWNWHSRRRCRSRLTTQAFDRGGTVPEALTLDPKRTTTRQPLAKEGWPFSDAMAASSHLRSLRRGSPMALRSSQSRCDPLGHSAAPNHRCTVSAAGSTYRYILVPRCRLQNAHFFPMLER